MMIYRNQRYIDIMRRRLMVLIPSGKGINIPTCKTNRYARFCSSTTSSFKINESCRKEEVPVTSSGDLLLYKSSESFTIRLMLGCGLINLVYWPSSMYYSTTQVLVKTNTFIDSLQAFNPLITGVGVAATGLVLFATTLYAHRSVRIAYENRTTKRLGFQMHNLFGYPGKIIEIKPSNVSIIPTKRVTSKVAIKVNGLSHPIVLARDGEYYDKGRLADILNTPTEALLLQESQAMMIKQQQQKRQPTANSNTATASASSRKRYQ